MSKKRQGLSRARLVGALLTRLQASRWIPTKSRASLLRHAGSSIGKGVTIAAGCTVQFPQELRIRDGVFMNVGVFLDARGGLTIDENVFIADGVSLNTATHTLGDSARRAGPTVGRPILIGAGTWIGSGAVITAGTEVGPGCVIAAGAVVVRTCKPDGLYAGVPAKFVRALGLGRGA